MKILKNLYYSKKSITFAPYFTINVIADFWG